MPNQKDEQSKAALYYLTPGGDPSREGGMNPRFMPGSFLDPTPLNQQHYVMGDATRFNVSNFPDPRDEDPVNDFPQFSGYSGSPVRIMPPEMALDARRHGYFAW